MDPPKTPKTPGRSRFSKALPAPPPFEETLFPPRTVSSRQDSLGLPRSPRPSPATSTAPSPTASKPVNTSLPPLPLKTSAALPTMSISRKPVGGASLPAVPAPEASPTGSLSSILSAYSRGSGESIIRGSEGTASTKTSYHSGSPSKEAYLGASRKDDLLTPISTFSYDNEPQKPAPAQKDFAKEESNKSPTVLEKNEPRPTTPPTSSEAQDMSPMSMKSVSSLLKRREQKTEQKVGVPELHLAGSNGSTAATQPPMLQPPAAGPPALLPPNPPFISPSVSPRSPSGLVGRNIRPVASREVVASSPAVAEAAPKVQAGGDANVTQSQQSGPGSNPPFQRLPTPDYEQHDVQSPLIEQIVSPVSPASSPELPSQQTDAKQSLPRMALGGRDIRPQNKNAAPSPIESSAVAQSTAMPTQQSAFPARTSSRATKPAQVLPRREPAAPAPQAMQGAAALSVLDDFSDAVDETTGKWIGDGERMMPEGCKVPALPATFTTLAPPNTVFAAPPIQDKHYRCMYKHVQGKMRESANVNCPLSCQTCERKDREIRFKCHFCYLRICKACMDQLNESGGDLATLVKQVEKDKANVLRMGDYAELYE